MSIHIFARVYTYQLSFRDEILQVHCTKGGKEYWRQQQKFDLELPVSCFPQIVLQKFWPESSSVKHANLSSVPSWHVLWKRFCDRSLNAWCPRSCPIHYGISRVGERAANAMWPRICYWQTLAPWLKLLNKFERLAWMRRCPGRKAPCFHYRHWWYAKVQHPAIEISWWK
jgi:hypothetical protein